MKLILIYTLIISAGAAFCQLPGDHVRHQIAPLRASRADVGKIAREVGIHGAYKRYETSAEFIDVEYSELSCTWHGWNVLPETVLSFNVYPKSSVVLQDLDLIGSKGYVRTIDDSLIKYYSNDTLGVRVAVRQDGSVSHIKYGPRKEDYPTRCKGFPPYSLAAETYSPIVSFTLQDISTWDVGLLGGLLPKIRDDPSIVGTIFLYSRKGRTGTNQNLLGLKSRIREYTHEVLRISKDRLRIESGGLRDEAVVEAFLTPMDSPPPVPRPKYPAD